MDIELDVEAEELDLEAEAMELDAGVDLEADDVEDIAICTRHPLAEPPLIRMLFSLPARRSRRRTRRRKKPR